MSKATIKAAAQKASVKADGVTDSLLTRVIASPYTWAVVLCWFMLGVAVGKFVL